MRALRPLVDEVLAGLSRRFDGLCVPAGRPSIPPERLLRSLPPEHSYSIRSERLLVEQLDYNLLLGWFVGLEMDEGPQSTPSSARIPSGCSMKSTQCGLRST